MSEKAFKAHVKRGLRKIDPRLHWQAIEDAYSTGIPDVSYAFSTGREGWIEFKYLKQWPKRPDTIVRLDHFTPEQRNWLTKRGKLTGRAFLFLQVERDYMLFMYNVVPKVGALNKAQLIQLAYRHWRERINFNKLYFSL